ncbi:uncharacterized protein EV422DRAFT_198933 [Fimicolochytrium jonesii]|uniref:uncharacterized protein n=1 Tax=Fimicolochytrium jonesii TaxID=1396493 RepID=UPI0022FE689C|nr:uncharacterized protein EV422DRAFT_198933 [Fimicolochytrium jonesii]KAI8817935.1 hypothetical protein EV422DRAFT_198933 [Fimicolochytrium jonesii]
MLTSQTASEEPSTGTAMTAAKDDAFSRKLKSVRRSSAEKLDLDLYNDPAVNHRLAPTSSLASEMKVTKTVSQHTSSTHGISSLSPTDESVAMMSQVLPLRQEASGRLSRSPRGYPESPTPAPSKPRQVRAADLISSTKPSASPLSRELQNAEASHRSRSAPADEPVTSERSIGDETIDNLRRLSEISGPSPRKRVQSQDREVDIEGEEGGEGWEEDALNLGLSLDLGMDDDEAYAVDETAEAMEIETYLEEEIARMENAKISKLAPLAAEEERRLKERNELLDTVLNRLRAQEKELKEAKERLSIQLEHHRRSLWILADQRQKLDDERASAWWATGIFDIEM